MLVQHKIALGRSHEIESCQNVFPNTGLSCGSRFRGWLEDRAAINQGNRKSGMVLEKTRIKNSYMKAAEPNFLRRHGGMLNLRRHNPTYRLFLTKRGFLRLGPRL